MFKKLALVAALAAIGTAAHAATDQTYTAVDALTSSNLTELASFSHKGESGWFFDTFNFTIGGTGGNLSASAVSVEMGSAFGISGLTATLWDNFHPMGTVELGTLVGDTVVKSFGYLAAGQYHFDFTGLITGSTGGAYGAGVTLAPVPEPETYAMFLAGLGILGVVARRRNRS